MGTVGPKCWGPETGYQQNNSWGPKMGPTTKPGVTNCDGRPQTKGPETGRQTWGVKEHLRVVYVHLLTSLVFTPSYYRHYWKLLKNSNIG